MRGWEGRKSEDRLYARTLISPNWRMRGRIASDAIILSRVNGRQQLAVEGEEGGGMMAVKSQPGELRPKSEVFK